ncbi:MULTISPECIES: ribbon-helix-helix domain-containing protein [Rhizobium]|uniref:ribbon-helix-helix domain-containing protein n=1 Tax=Rhizobium TaxID=379 RepID=UPI001EF0B6B5|nr:MULTISPECIES: type II toxin-antitoxin system ParD family antitoxin [Rhizobium]
MTKWKRHHAAISKNEDASVAKKNCYFLLDAFVIQAMRTLTISLSPQQIARLHNAVESGAYATNNEVIRDALRLWEQREEARQMEMSRLKKAYDGLGKRQRPRGRRSHAFGRVEGESP